MNELRVAVELDGAQHLADPVAYRRDRRENRGCCGAPRKDRHAALEVHVRVGYPTKEAFGELVIGKIHTATA